MEGSMRRRGKKSWELSLDLGRDEKGRRRRKFTSVQDTKAQAQRRLRELLSDLDKGVPAQNSKVTLGEHLVRWLSDYARTNTSPRTVQGYEGAIRRYLVPSLGHIPLIKLTPVHVQALYSEMLDRPLSPQTILHTHRILKQSLSHAIAWGLIIRNVCDAVHPPSPKRKEMTAVDASGVQTLLEEARSSPYGPVIFLALYTGLRRSELMGLRWRAIDLESKSLSVTETLVRITGEGLKIMQPKTSRSRRAVSLPPTAVALLSGLKVKQREQRQAVGLDWSESDYVFSNADGSWIDPDTISHSFSDIIKRAGLPHMRFHDLRHTHATLMLKQGVHPKVVSERLGHASITITLDTYSHVLPGLQEEAAMQFEEVLRSPKP